MVLKKNGITVRTAERKCRGENMFYLYAFLVGLITGMLILTLVNIKSDYDHGYADGYSDCMEVKNEHTD